MPIYEYLCRGCGKRFETLVLGSRRPACPDCAGRDLDKQLSVFAAGSSRGGAPSPSGGGGPCGSCGDPRGPGACATD